MNRDQRRKFERKVHKVINMRPPYLVVVGQPGLGDPWAHGSVKASGMMRSNDPSENLFVVFDDAGWTREKMLLWLTRQNMFPQLDEETAKTLYDQAKANIIRWRGMGQPVDCTTINKLNKERVLQGDYAVGVDDELGLPHVQVYTGEISLKAVEAMRKKKAK